MTNFFATYPGDSPGGGSGTVTSVGLTVPSFLSVSGSPITTSGTFAVSYSGTALPTANGGTGVVSTATFPTSGTVAFLAATPTTDGIPHFSSTTGQLNSSTATLDNTGHLTIPATGNLKFLSFNTSKALVTSGSTGVVIQSVTTSAELAHLSGITSTAVGISDTQTLTNKSMDGGSNTFTNLPFSAVTGTVPIAQGGTGQVTANTALNALLPTQATNSGKHLSTDGTNTSWVTPAVGTVTSVAMSVPTFMSVSGSPITGAGTFAVTLSGTALPILNGGTGQTTANAALNALLPTQTSNAGKQLSTDGTNTSWVTPAAGTVTSVALTVPGFLSVSGSPVTGAGTLAMSLSGTALPVANGGTGLTSGSSGGILGYTASGTLAASGALTANGVVLGGGAGATPTSTSAGTSGQLLVGVTSGAPSFTSTMTAVIDGSSSSSGFKAETARSSPSNSDTQNIYSGTYTPTWTNLSNTSSLTPGVANWYRVGQMVTVFGTGTLSNAGGSLAFTSTLPIAITGTFASATLAAGTASGGNTNNTSWAILANTGTSNVEFETPGAMNNGSTLTYSFSYKLQ